MVSETRQDPDTRKTLARAGPMGSQTRQDPDTRKTCIDYDTSDCDYGQYCCNEICYDSLEDCIGIDEDTLYGIGVAAFVAAIVVPIVCRCCCCGCAAYWITRSRKSRTGQVHMQQPGMVMMPPQGQAYQPQMMQGQEQVQQPGGFDSTEKTAF